MRESYKEKVYEFSKTLQYSNEWVGNIQVVQIGETCLDKSACIEEHIQTCHEITYVISGKGTLISNKESVECNAGDIQIISKGVSHKLVADKDTQFRYIHFAFGFDNYEPKELAEFYGQCTNIFIRDSRTIKHLLNMLVDEYYKDSGFTNIVRDNLIQLVLVMIWRRVHEQSDSDRIIPASDTMGNLVYNIIKYVDEHISGKVTVAEISRHFSYSVSYISHLFKIKTGVPLREYIIAVRMSHARDLLMEGKTSLAEIAHIAGYYSIQSFCKRFKQHAGITTGSIKRRIKE